MFSHGSICLPLSPTVKQVFAVSLQRPVLNYSVATSNSVTWRSTMRAPLMEDKAPV